MNWEITAIISLALAAIPAALTLLNLRVYRPPPPFRLDGGTPPPVSVLIPARDEAANIGAAVAAVLANDGLEFELVVLDDHSTDNTAEIVRQIAASDPRVRLEHAPPLPAGWCGKQHACHLLAGHAAHPLLVFVDADVRLAPDALARMAAFMARPGAPALASGFPLQRLGTFWERLLLPLIHFVLLGFLPMHPMRWTRRAGFSAGCGQLFIARRDAYRETGGHAMIRASLHDGVKLPRLFRRHGHPTDLFDATGLATCRMYHCGAEVLAGLGKNAVEGLAAPGTILPMTVLLTGGQILPFLLLAGGAWLPGTVFPVALTACALAWLPRAIAVGKFAHPVSSALLHPFGVAVLLAIQWLALVRRFTGRPSQWKSRSYGPACAVLLAFLAAWTPLAAAPPEAPGRLPVRTELPDAQNQPHHLSFPAKKVTVLSLADRHGREQARDWTPALKSSKDEVAIFGIANAKGTPGFMKENICKRIHAAYGKGETLLIDWTGELCARIGCQPGKANLAIIGRDGSIRYRLAGPATPENQALFFAALKQIIAAEQ